MKNIMKKAHEITKKIIRKGDSYRETFRLALIFVHSQIKKGVNKMIELKGTEKQVKYASDIKSKLVATMKDAADAIEEIQSQGTKRSKRRDKIATQLREEIETINKIEEAKEIIETYKNLSDIRLNAFMNEYVTNLK
ncbi:MAG: hypothetical protein RSD36_18190 [Terrisporobacter sp.]